MTAEVIPDSDVDVQTAVSTKQYTLAGNDGATWQDMDGTGLLTIGFTPAASGPALINANADLWTSLAGVNQDIGILISGGSFGAGQVVAWRRAAGTPARSRPMNSFWMLSGNVGLWTASAGVNQDVALFVSGGAYGTGTLVAWKESGGFAGSRPTPPSSTPYFRWRRCDVHRDP